ncbi:MAG: DNA primase noncatalytic subunit PriX [Saccharolobus sp.]
MSSKKRIKRIILHYPDDTLAGYVEYEDGISKVYDSDNNLLFKVESVFPPIPKRTADYSWIDKILEKGLQDARKRFILYVASRYLINVKGLSEDEALTKLKEFYYKALSGKVYESWLKSVISGVKKKGFLPWSLKKIEERDKEMYNEIMKILKDNE